MEIDKLVAVEKQDDHVMKIIIDNYERTKDFLFTAMIPEQRLVVEEFIEVSFIFVYYLCYYQILFMKLDIDVSHTYRQAEVE